MKKLYLSDVGLIPDTYTDCTAKLIKIFAENPSDTEFIFEKGRYDFTASMATEAEYFLSNSDVMPMRKLAVLMKEMKNVVLDGNGCEFSFHGQLQPITADRCENITLKNFTIDWEKPLVSEGTIAGRGDNFADVRIDQNLFPCVFDNDWLYFDIGDGQLSPIVRGCHIEYDRASMKVAPNTGDYFSIKSIERIDGETFRFYTYGNPGSNRAFIGNILVLRHNARIHAGIFAEKSKNMKIENITVHSCGGLGCLMQFCENVSFDKVDFVPNTKKGRLISSGRDDGMQISNCSGEVVIENCTFRGLMDDPINVHGTSVEVASCEDDKTLICTYTHGQSVGFRWWGDSGHTIAILGRKSMTRDFECEIESYERIDMRSFRLRFRKNIPENILTSLNSDGGSKLFAAENMTNSPSFICRNNVFGSCRARGILVSTPKDVLIEKNVFDSSGCAVLVAGDANGWFESGACGNVLICENFFTDACLSSMYQFCDGIISVCPVVPEPDIEKPFHREIRIEKNVFYTPDTPVLYAFSTGSLIFEHNRIYHSSCCKKWHPGNEMFRIEYCKHAKIHDNHITGEFLLEK